MADKKISEFDSFQGTQDSKVHYIISSGDAGGQDTDNYKVSFPDLVLSVSGELKDSLGGGGGVPGPGGSFNFGPTEPSNNTDVVNFNQGENVRMYIDQDGAVNVSEKLVVSDGKETVLGGATEIKGETTIQEKLTVANGKETVLGGATEIKGETTIQEKLTVANGKETVLGGPVTIKGDSTFEQSAIFTDLTNDPDPSTGKLYRKGDDIYFGGQKLLTDGSSGAGKWSDGTTAGQIHYSGGNVGIGIDAPTAKLHVSRLDQHETDSALTVIRGDTSLGDRPTAPIFNVFNGQGGGTEVFRVQGNGNVGIGETDPGQKLVVRNHSTTNNRVAIGLSSQDGTQNGSISHIDEEGKERITLSAGGFSVDQLAILNNGNVGIGTTEPDRLLEIFGSVNAGNLTALKLTNNLANDNGESVSIEFGGYGDRIMGLIEARMRSTDSDSDLIFSTNPGTNDTSLSEHMRILANGNVGIGLERASATSAAVLHSKTTPLQVNKPGDEVVSLLTLSNYDHTDNSTSQGSALDFGLSRDSGTQKSNSGRIYVGKTEVWTNDDATMNSFMSFNIFTANNLSEKLRITSEGVGISANPSKALDINGHIKTRGIMPGVSNDGDAFSAIRAGNATINLTDNGHHSSMSIGASLGDDDVAADNTGLYIGSYAVGTNATNVHVKSAIHLDNHFTASKGIRFFTGTGTNEIVQRMVIKSNGDIGIGTDPVYRFHTLHDQDLSAGVLFENHAAQPHGVIISHPSAQGTQTGASSGYFLTAQSQLNGSNQDMLAIANNGNVSNRYNSYGQSSDIKLKENIVDATPKTEDLKQVRVVNFNFKDSPDEKQIGVIAQELEDVFPGMVYETEDLEDGAPTGETSKAVKYSVFVPMLVKAFQEQQAIIEDLKSRIETLEN